MMSYHSTPDNTAADRVREVAAAYGAAYASIDEERFAELGALSFEERARRFIDLLDLGVKLLPKTEAEWRAFEQDRELVHYQQQVMELMRRPDDE